jgi:hypothetical protein
MGELKPIGSEKLQGDAQIKRILDLTYYQSNKVLKESSMIVKEAKSGVYGIVKEKDGYYVKKGLNENSLDYIGGLFMKNKNKFSSYNEALKKLEFLTEQETLNEATKYVLKQNKPAPPIAPAAEEPVSAAPDPATAPAADPMAADEPVPSEDPTSGEDVDDPNDYMKVLKKMAGRLQEKLNKYEDRLESKDYAEIIKQILSAVDVEKLEETDIDDIMSVFEDDEVDGTTDFPTDDSGEVPAPADTEAPIEEELPIVNDNDEGLPVDPLSDKFNDGGMGPMNPSDKTSLDGVASLDELINTPLDDDYFGDDEDSDNELDSFLNDPEIKKAGKVATSDMEKDEFGDVSKYPKYSDEETDEYPDDSIEDFNDDSDKDIDEQLPISGTGEENVRELDLDELTNIVNNSVKETLGKYFK